MRITIIIPPLWGFPGGSVVKNLPANAGYTGTMLGWEDPWEKEISQPTPVFFLGKSHGERNLVGYIPWDHKAVNDNKNK